MCNGGSIPADILTTAQRPDIVVIDRKKKQTTIFKISVSFEREKNLDSANLKKVNRYHDLTTDLTQRGWVTNNTPFKIGSRGYINKRNKSTICDTMKNYVIKIKKSKLLKRTE